MSNINSIHWPRMIAFIDMDCFFAQIEKRDNPAWRHRPVGVTNGQQGTTLITCCYQARKAGIKTGMKLYAARNLAPALVQAPSRPYRYAEISSAIMSVLLDMSPTVEVYSVDEAFLDLTACQSINGSPEQIGEKIKQAIATVYGLELTCSVGISGDKTTAKYAAKLNKPNGLKIIPPWQSETLLANVPLTDLSGISTGISRYLARYNIHQCGDMKKVPMSLIAQRFGNLGRRIWLMAQGKDPEPIISTIKDPKSLGHGKVLPPKTKSREVLLIYFQHMAEKVGSRLRKHHYIAEEFYIAFRSEDDWIGSKMKLEQATNDGAKIYALCKAFVMAHYAGRICRQVTVTALNPSHHKQTDLFIDSQQDEKRKALNQTIDSINERFGEFTVAPLQMLGRSKMPNVIAPAWKPSGHRRFI